MRNWVWLSAFFLLGFVRPHPEQAPRVIATQANFKEAHSILRRAREAATIIQDPSDRSQALSDIAGLQARGGDLMGARESAKLLRDPSERVDAWHRIALSLASTGSIEASRATIALIPDDRYREQCLSEVSFIQAKQGDLRGALKTVSAIANPEQRTETLTQLAAAQVKKQEDAETRELLVAATDAAQTIPDQESKIRGLLEITVIEAKAGARLKAFQMLRQLRQTISSIEARPSRSFLLAELARSQAECGDIPGAYRIVISIPRDMKNTALGNIAKVQLEKGDIAGASITVACMPGYKVDLLEKIAEARAANGDIDGALKSAHAIGEKTYERVALVEVAAAQAKWGQPEAALETTSKISDADLQFEALVKVAANLYQRGDKQSADQILQRASNLASAIGNSWARAEALREIARVQVESKHLAAARSTAKLIPVDGTNGWRKAEVLERISYGQTETGDLKGALRLAGEEKSPLVRVYALMGIAEALLKVELPGGRIVEAIL